MLKNKQSGILSNLSFNVSLVLIRKINQIISNHQKQIKNLETLEIKTPI